MTEPFVLFYAANAGALSSMVALYESPKNSFHCRWFVDDIATHLIKYSKDRNISSGCIYQFVKDHAKNISVLVLGPQHNTTNTTRLLSICAQTRVPTIFITDHWGRNTQSIFSKTGLSESPTLIFAIDDCVVKELTFGGITEERICTVGHLGIQRKLNLLNKLHPGDIEKERLKYFPGRDTLTILLVLEIYLKESTTAKNQYWMVSEVWNILQSNLFRPFKLVVRPHPSDDENACRKYINRLHGENILFSPNHFEDYWSIAVSDIVIGSNTTLLSLSAVYGIPTISIIYGPGARSTIPSLKDCRVDNSLGLAKAIKKSASGEWPVGEIVHPFADFEKAWREISLLIDRHHN
jgi:hypothetical protein